MTAGDLIRRALASVRVIGEGETPSGEQMSQAFTTLNQFLRMLGAEGLVTLQYASLADDLDLPDGYDLMLETNLAVLLAPRFGKEASATLQRVALSTKRVLKRTAYEPAPLSLRQMPGNSGWYDILTNEHL